MCIMITHRLTSSIRCLSFAPRPADLIWATTKLFLSISMITAATRSAKNSATELVDACRATSTQIICHYCVPGGRVKSVESTGVMLGKIPLRVKVTNMSVPDSAQVHFSSVCEQSSLKTWCIIPCPFASSKKFAQSHSHACAIAMTHAPCTRQNLAVR